LEQLARIWHSAAQLDIPSRRFTQPHALGARPEPQTGANKMGFNACDLERSAHNACWTRGTQRVARQSR
jgi:hypothetical protein